MTATIADTSVAQFPARRVARIAGALYALNTVTSLYSYYGPQTRPAFYSGLIGTASYVAITILFYFLFKPVSRSLSLAAALFGTAGNVIGALGAFHLSLHINALVFFGFYCALIGYLIFRARFLPHWIGGLMALAGVGYLTSLWPSMAARLQPWNLIPGGLGEWTLTIWLLVVGLNQQRWFEQAGKAHA